MKPGPSSIDVLKRLIAFDTTSRNSNLALIHHIRDHLAELGVESTLVPNEQGTKANLFASIGPAVEGGIVLSGSNSRTADEFAAGIAEAERLRAALIGEIDLTLVPEPTRLLH